MNEKEIISEWKEYAKKLSYPPAARVESELVSGWWLKKLSDQREELENDFKKTLNSNKRMYELGVKEERKRIFDRLGFMRQWLNEDRVTEQMVTNDELQHWLNP